MKTYEAVFDESEVDGVFGISLVQDPAMESTFIALNKQENIIQFAAVDEKEYILAGLVLSPDKPVYRNQDGEEFEMFFTADTVKRLCYAFTKNKFNNNSTEEHDEQSKIAGISFVENWIVRDEKNDTSLALGLSPKKGDWISVAKCDNKEIYEKALAGTFTGFSIDAMIKLKQVNLKSNINMSEFKETFKEFTDDLMIKLNLKEKEVVADAEVEVKLGSVKSADGQFAFMFDGETAEVGGAIWIEAEDGTKVPVPVAEYELETGMILTVAEEGVIGSVMEAQAEELEAEAAPNTGSEDAGNVINQVQESIKSIMIKYSETNDEKFKAIESQLAELLELKKEVIELSKAPAAKPLKQVAQVELTSKGRLLNKIRNNKN